MFQRSRIDYMKVTAYIWTITSTCLTRRTIARILKRSREVQLSPGQTMPPSDPFWTAEQLGLYAKWRTDEYQPDDKLVDTLRAARFFKERNSKRPARMTPR